MDSVVFSDGLLSRFTHDIVSAYPRKTFGYFFARRSGSSDSVVCEYYLFQDDARGGEHASAYFERIGEYYVNNSNAGFLATPEESLRVDRWQREQGLKKVGAFHTHLRHPAYLARIDQYLHPRPDLFHLIISLRNPAHPELAAWARVGENFVPMGIWEGGSQLAPPTGEGGYFPVLSGIHQPVGQDRLSAVRFVAAGSLLVADAPITSRAFADVFPRFTFRDEDADKPVTGVSFLDARAYCLSTGTRLLTEAEWVEVGLGVDTSHVTSHVDHTLGEYAWYSENSDNQLWPVRKRRCNEHGIYDMQGNAWEWCAPSAGATGSFAPTKGGGYLAFAEMCSPKVSHMLPVEYRAPDLSFRVCIDSAGEG